MTAAITISDLVKSYGEQRVLDGVSFDVAPGEIVGLLGPNGAGKTTLIRCLTTLTRPDGGRITVAGHDVVTEPDAVRSSLALTGQFAAVDDVLSGVDNLVFFGRLLGLSKAAARGRADELLGQFDLTDAAKKPVSAYSGGMRRRLDLAISLVVPRPVVVLDEPTTGLDLSSRQALWAAVRALGDSGSAVLLTTQYLEEADQLADRVAVLHDGKVVALDTPEALKARVGGSVCEIHFTEADARAKGLAVLSEQLAGVTTEDDAIVIPASDTHALAAIVRVLDSTSMLPDDMRLRYPTLDSVFLTLTGAPAVDRRAEPAGPQPQEAPA